MRATVGAFSMEQANGCARLAGLLLVVTAVVIGVPPVGWAQTPIWIGPGDACLPNTLLGDWGGLRARLADYGIGFGLQEQTEVWGNLAGGVKRGAMYDGLTTANLCIDLDKAMHWQGATIYADGFQIYGRAPTPDYVGALQLISSIEATPSTKLYALWFEQQLFDRKVAIRFGQDGLDDEFMAASYDALFLNSSFTFPRDSP